MELWMIGGKASLLFYVVAATCFLSGPGSAWDIFACLLYLILNVAMLLFPRRSLSAALLLLSSSLIVLCAARLSPEYALLLPPNLLELAELRTRAEEAKTHAPLKLALPLLLALVPLPFLPKELMPLYAFAAALSLLLFFGLRAERNKLSRMEHARDRMKADLERLTRALGENEAYRRQSEYTSKLEERNRLSQRIHDEIGHSMAGALIQMEASRRLLESDRAKSAELLGNAIAISKEGLERIRLALKDIKPKAEELGIHRLRLYADELSARLGSSVATTVTHQGDLDAITPLQWKIIQENATEALTNALKYSGATVVGIEVNVLNRFVQSIVSDNGVGAAKVVKGLGIAGMEERAASVGGTVVVDGTRGFRVTTLLPREGG
ncbi:sensor histidine kinase [Cohnella fermenti]|uniref:histidine kinase n=1 Tax=Cohnella fermenti TaxID=2565925 RepID=A0A4S4BHE2_9BACL|nr:histidine kinase [Cohnella fermenti]THF73956.1 sensor histidine kinase [Cohnella fermenti]